VGRRKLLVLLSFPRFALVASSSPSPIVVLLCEVIASSPAQVPLKTTFQVNVQEHNTEVSLTLQRAARFVLPRCSARWAGTLFHRARSAGVVSFFANGFKNSCRQNAVIPGEELSSSSEPLAVLGGCFGLGFSQRRRRITSRCECGGEVGGRWIDRLDSRSENQQG